MDVTRITSRYIFYDDGTRENANSQNLLPILNDATRDKTFYIRMYNELREMYDKAKLNFDHGTPAPDQNNYYERVGVLSGLSDAMKEADKKGLHALQIETQCRIALGLDRPNMVEMYPEMRLKK